MMHVEFVVPGEPVSSQTGNPSGRKAWQAAVRAEAGKAWAAPPLTGRLKLLLVHFHEGDEPRLDDDNMAKPIRDALSRVVYADDRQVRHSEVIQVGLDDPVRARGASRVVLAALHAGGPCVYVRIEDMPTAIQLPG